jgi:hypothetical protein
MIVDSDNPADNGYRDNELFDLTNLLSEGLDEGEAREVLGPHAALSRKKVEERWAMIRRERGDGALDVAKRMLADALPADKPHVVKEGEK